MARIFITGSTDGLGEMAASALISQGHRVTLHARNEKRAREVSNKVRGAEAVLIADLSSMEETKKLAADVNGMGRFDAVIHNAGVYQVSNNALSVDGLPVLLAINTIAPYILTSLIHPPQRLIYLTSGLHSQGDAALNGLQRNKLRISYSDSKLHDLILCKAVARRWPDVRSNAVNPGWVPTKMGGPGATDDLEEGYRTQVWLAISDDEKAKVSGRYFYHRQEARYLTAADDVTVQEKFLSLCEQISGIRFPLPRPSTPEYPA